jgi:hypothetical protein
MRDACISLKFYRKFLFVLIICLFVTPLSDMLNTLWEVNVINGSQGQGTHSYYYFFLILRLFPLTSHKVSGEFFGVVNCITIPAKWRRQLPVSTIKDEKSKDFC